jgi:uncharacterized protein
VVAHGPVGRWVERGKIGVKALSVIASDEHESGRCVAGTARGSRMSCGVLGYAERQGPPMERLVADRQTEIMALCRTFRVRRLELFGSAVTGAFDPASSDLDFVVEFGDLNQGEWADAYFGLMEGLTELFRRPVDLVMLSAVRNPYLLRSIAATRSLLYAA